MAKARDPAHTEELLDEALEESFPASDPPSITRPGDLQEPASNAERREDKAEAPDQTVRR